MTASNKARYCRCGVRLARDNTDSRCSGCLAADRRRAVAAPEVPADFWDEVVIHDALRSEHMGRVIRAWRTHPYHGRQDFPQDRVASWVGLTQTQLSRIENGAPIMHLDRLRQWATVLRIPPERLWFAVSNNTMGVVQPHQFDRDAIATNDDDAEGEASGAWVPLDTVEMVSKFTREDLSLDRREATRAIAGMVFGGVFLERLERWLWPSEQIVSKRICPSGIGSEEVEQIEHAAQLFRSWDDRFGGGLRRKAVVGQLSEVADEIRDFSHPPHLEKRLFGAMAQLAETAATMSWDSGQGAVAQRYYVMALRAAKEAGDRAFGANILAGMARQLFYLGRVADGLELVRLAQDGAGGRATPTIQAMLQTREAWAYAKQGRLGAFRRATSRAEDYLRDSRPSDDPYWINYFDEAELAGVTGGRLLEAAHTHAALATETVGYIQRAVEMRRPQSLRSAALDQLGLAEAFVIQGEAHEASRLGHEAADVVEKTPSDRVRVKLVELYQQTDAYAAVPSVAQFRDRVRGILSASRV